MEGALDLLEVHSRFLDQPQKMNECALPQSGQIGPPNYCEQRTGVYDDLHMRREGGFSGLQVTLGRPEKEVKFT